MKIISAFLIGVGVAFLIPSYGQSSQPNSLQRGNQSVLPEVTHHKKKKTKFFSPQRSVYRKPNVKHTAQYEFYERVEKAAKERQKILKQLSKPQFSDYRYFGHKKIPKKRPSYKMRYCDECGIRH